MTMESNQAIEMTYGTEILTDGNGTENMTEPNQTGNDMDQFLPPSIPGTPQLSSCQRRRDCITLIDLYTSSIEHIKASLRQLQVKRPIADQPSSFLDHIFKEHEQRLSDYTRLLNLTVIKSTAVKRKETDIGFVSFPTCKLSKNLRTNANPDSNFCINLSYKFNGLEIQEPSSNPVAGTSTGNPSATNTTKNSTTIVSDNDKKLPPPIMLKITDDYRVQMKIVNNFLPKIRNKMSGEYFKLYCDTHDQFHELNAFLEAQNFEFYSITPKHLRPIKVVIKGLPKDTKTHEIHQDLLGDSPLTGSPNLPDVQQTNHYPFF
ncbi:hypothetical protein TNCV_283931 [Trichonephila clavipes]|uniref:Uncharacterized protein n=1 Tax=Trichonephila clavipes TaxID=2585209 RepID=A0A8X6VMQ9_TRICX|nr:hypothetical protein TNCV_283931 [Trichonephila clavipes]